MKIKFILLLAVIAAFSADLCAQTEYNIERITVLNLGDGRILHRSMDNDKPLEGQHRLIDGYHSAYLLAEFKDGLYDGSYQYFKSNALREEGTYKEGRKHGTFKTYLSDGTTVSEVKVYAEGKADGMWINYYTDGKPEKEKEYKNGLEHGVERIYDYESGEVKTLKTYAEGKLHGKQLMHYTSNRGNYVVDATYENGLAEGPYSETFEDGVIKKQGVYKKGKEDGRWIFNKQDGMPERIADYKDGKLNGEVHKFYTDGTVNTIQNYKDDKLNGVTTEYYYDTDGKIKSEFTYLNGKRHGPYKRYTEEGTVKEEGTYENDRKK